MPNIDFKIRESGGQGGRTVVVDIRALETELHDFTIDLVNEAVAEGERVAKSLAPRGKDWYRRRGPRLDDAIRSTKASYRPGGAGGGGSQRAELIADGEIAPQVRWVYEGTADEGSGRIYPARGNVLAIEKEGEGVQFRAWAHGQKPQREWWERAQDSMDAYIKDRIRSSGLGEAVRK